MIHPGIGDKRKNLCRHVSIDARPVRRPHEALGRVLLEPFDRARERDVLVVAEVRVGLWMAPAAGGDRGVGVSQRECVPDRLVDGFRERAEASDDLGSVGRSEAPKRLETVHER